MLFNIKRKQQAPLRTSTAYQPHTPTTTPALLLLHSREAHVWKHYVIVGDAGSISIAFGCVAQDIEACKL
jgi:hypothetical protein